MRIRTFVATAFLAASSLQGMAVAQEDCELPPIRKDWVDTAIALTTYAETGRAADYGAIADNSDKQGMSVGLLQWNFGQGTISKIILGAPNAAELAKTKMPKYGDAFVKAAVDARSSAGRDEAMAWVIATQQSDRATLHAEVRAFLKDPAIAASQDAAALAEANEAWRRAREWMWNVRNGCRPQFAQFAVFFDYLNHGGQGNAQEITDVVAAYGTARGKNVNSATRREYSQYIAYSEATWVMGYPHYRPCERPKVPRSADNGVKRAHGWDAQYNCSIWRDSIDGNSSGWDLWENEIFFLAALGAKFRPGAREIFLNRKGTLAFGLGVINGSLCDFRELYFGREQEHSDSLESIAAKVEASCKAATPAPS